MTGQVAHERSVMSVSVGQILRQPTLDLLHGHALPPSVVIALVFHDVDAPTEWRVSAHVNRVELRPSRDRTALAVLRTA